MARRLLPAARAVIILAMAALCAACSGGGEPVPAYVAGEWNGFLTLEFSSSPDVSGEMTITFNQEGDFASGSAEWSALNDDISITGPLNGNNFTFYLHFRCPSKKGGVTLEGAVDGDIITVTGAFGTACFSGGPDIAVSGGAGTLGRASDTQPLNPSF